jgi:hypothetical protein
MDLTMMPTRYRQAEGACDLGYEDCEEAREHPYGLWWVGLFAAIFGFGVWFWRRPRPLAK